MAMTRTRRVRTKAGAAPALPELSGQWSPAEADAATEELFAALENANAGANDHLSQIITLGAWIVAHKLRTEAWLGMAFERIQMLERDLKKAKSASSLSYKGVWKQGEETNPGEFVTSGGSVWHCNKKTLSRPGDDPSSFTLAVKRGADGKDARP